MEKLSITTASEDLENGDSNESDSLDSSDDNSTDHYCINCMAFIDNPKAKANRYTITGDNLDKSIQPRFMTMDHQTQSLHYFHSYV